MSYNQVKNNVIGFFGKSFSEWFDAHLEYKLKAHFDKILTKELEECGLQEYIIDVYTDEYLDDIANSDNSGFNFYKYLQDHQINHKSSVFINVWIECCNWYKENYGIKKEIKSQEQAWNTIAYWIVKEHCANDWEELFVEKFTDEYLMYKDNKTKPSRIACGICWENKLLYTGCSTCKGNYICYSCYNHLENDNECPFCRSQEMILDIEATQRTDDLWDYLPSEGNSLNFHNNTNSIFAYNVVPELMSVLENRIIN